jgi:hypothetical protein
VISIRFTSFSRIFLLAVLVALAGTAELCAQVTAGASPGLNAALVRLFEGVTAFSAQLEIRMLDAKGAETLNAPMQFNLLDGKMRGEIDVAKLKSKDLPEFAATAAKSVGMDKVVTLVRPDKGESYLLYPAFQACVVAPIDAEDLAALKKPAKLQKTPLGREMLDGQDCVRNRVIVTEADGSKHEVIVWSATRLKGFPVRIKTVDKTGTIFMHFRQVKFEKPDAKLFDLPAGTTKYDDASELTQAVMKKLLGQALTK